MKIINLDHGKLFVIFDRFYDLSELKSVVNSQQGSYAEEITERIYQSLFSGTKNLRKEYDDYYAVEYDSFSKFLYWRYLINEAESIEIESDLTEQSYVGYGKDGLYLFEDEIVKHMLDHIFNELGEQINENTD